MIQSQLNNQNSSVAQLLNELNKKARLTNERLNCIKCAVEEIEAGGGGGSTGTSCENPTFVDVCNQIDLTAAETSLQDIITALDILNESVNNIEITSEAISLNAEQINLNTDQVEALITTTNTLLDGVEPTLIDIQTDTAKINDILTKATSACDDPTTVPLRVEVCNSVAATAYNKPFLHNVTVTGIYTPNSVHSISIQALSQDTTVQIGAEPAIPIPQGMTVTYTATDLLDEQIIINSTNAIVSGII